MYSNDHPDCENLKFARFSEGKWRCFEHLSKEMQPACIGEQNDLIACESGHFAGRRCTRNLEIAEIIKTGVLPTVAPSKGLKLETLAFTCLNEPS